MTTRENFRGSWLDLDAISVPATHRGLRPRRTSLSARAAQRRADSWGEWAQRHSKSSLPTGLQKSPHFPLARQLTMPY